MKLNVMFVPHPPIIMESVGGQDSYRAQCTIEGMTLLAKKVADIKPETIIFISPHGNSFSNGTCILGEDILSGDFSQFGHSEISFSKSVNMNISKKIYDSFEDRGLVTIFMDKQLASTYGVKASLDHGAMVPMFFIDQFYGDYKIVHITPGHTPLEENYFLGKLIKDVVDEVTFDNPSKVLLVASGDLSHALSDSGPYAFHQSGPVFDQVMKESIQKGDPLTLMNLSNRFIEDAAQCGLRSYLMGFGYFDGIPYDSKVISYEGPFGVGYLTGFLESRDKMVSHSLTGNKGIHEGVSFMESIKEMAKNKYVQRISKEDDYIRLARKTIEHYVRTSRRVIMGESIMESDFSSGFLSEAYSDQAGVFVSLHKDGKLRGCIGTTQASSESIFEEIIYNAISACSSDPRFHPVEEKELESLEISVDILKASEPISSMDSLDVKKYGLIVEQGFKRGLLLPNLDGIDSVDEQVSIAKQKAGIVTGKVDLYRFEVIRHQVLDEVLN